MEKWQIQQKINRLEGRKEHLEDEIEQLNGKKSRINSAIQKKGRQQMQISQFYSGKRQGATTVRTIARGVGVNQMLDLYEEIYSTTYENTIVGYLDDIIGYLNLNIEKIDDDISQLQGQLSSIVYYQLPELYKELRSADCEE